MKIERGDKPSSPKKESNRTNSILCDTFEKANEEFEFIAEYEDDSISFDEI